MAFKKATASVDVELNFNLEEECRNQTAAFFRTHRVVLEQETQDGGHPIEADVWLMDGPNARTYQPKMWIFPSGMRNKIDQTPGAHSAGRFEVYAVGKRDGLLGLTELTPEQLALAEKMDDYLTAHPGYEPAQPAAQQQAAPPAPAPVSPATPPPPPPATQQAPAPAPASTYPLGEQPVPAGVGAGSNGAYPDAPPF